MINKLLNEINKNVIEDGKYMYNNIYVPRVTEILKNMISEEYLLKWVYNLAIYKRKNYITERDRASFIGTLSHLSIENYFKNNLNMDEYNNASYEVKKQVNNCFNSFIKWYEDILSQNTIKIISLESELVCEYFGGTCDMIIEIGGNNYIVDFKTSNYVSYKYFLQLAAYKYILNKNGININGCIILQLDKKEIAYEEYVLNFNNKEHLEFINSCTEAFMSLVYGYYNIINVKNKYNLIFGEKK